MNRWLFTGLLFILLPACSDTPAEPDPEPEPQNTPMAVTANIPGDYRWDEPRAHSFSVVDEDGFSDGYVRFYIQRESESPELVWEKDFSSFSETRWDTTWTPQPFPSDAPLTSRGESWLEYELVDAFVGEKEVRSGTRSSIIRPSRLTEFDLRVENFSSGNGLNGYVTFSGWRTADVTNGLASITRDLAIDRDSLENGLYRILGEFSDAPTHSSVLQVENGEVLPVRVAEYDPELLYPTDRGLFEEGSLVTRRVPDGVNITNWLYDQSVGLIDEDTRDLYFHPTTDETLLAPKGFFDEVEQYLSQAISWITDVSGVTVTHKRESTSEETFPKGIDFTVPNYYFVNVGSPDARFTLNRGNSVDINNYLTNAFLLLRTGFERDGFSWPSAIAREMAENLGIPTSGPHGLKIADGRLETALSPWTNEAPEILRLQYSRPANSGIVILKGQGLENLSGTFTKTIGDWVSDW